MRSAFLRFPPAVQGLLVLVLLATAAAGMPRAARAQSQEPGEGRGRAAIRVGVYDNEPIIFRNAEGRADGFFIDILEEVARQSDWRIEYVYGNWTTVFEMARAGDIDLLPAVAWDRRRTAYFSYTEQALLTNWGQVYVPSGRDIQSLLGLDGKVVGVQTSDTHGLALLETLDKFGIQYAVVYYDTYRQLFEALEQDVADAVAVNRIFGSQNAREYQVQATSVVFNPIEIRFVAPLGDPRGLLPALDGRIALMKRDKDSVYHRSQTRWFGGVSEIKLPEWVLPLATILGGVLMVLAGMSVVMSRRVTARTAELVEARDAARAASEAKSRFLANMSHEVRTPLNGLLGMLQILRDTELRPQQEEYVRTALNSGRSLLTVINDVLDLSKIEAGSLDVVAEPFALADTVQSVCGLFHEEVRRKGIGLSCEVRGDAPPLVVGDPGRMRQILFNLVGNAVKFTRQGEVRVRVHTQPAGEWAEKLEVTVSDTGIGIPAEMVERCFEPFSQLDGSSTRAYGGVGLGLAIVRRLVDLMNGRIEVQSEPGKGTNILITLPVRAANAEERRALRLAGERSHGDPKRLRVLVGEDNRVNRLAMRRFLEKLGHTVLEATNGREVLEVLALEEVDCVLMDVQMPVMDGIQATRRIRAGDVGADRAGVRVLAVTAHAMKGDREEFLAAGMDGYLAKPVELEDLRAALAEHCGPAGAQG